MTQLEKYSIKVNIMSRSYPLLVKPEEEESVRNAAKLINEKIKLYRERFSVNEDLDLVVMCCLELAADNINQNNRLNNLQAKADTEISEISNALNQAILKTEEEILPSS